ncbi:MAG TPA: hypothetical protein PLK80_10660, partial [bacterium]|nr:hypothetical protein [bacterium]
SLLFPFYVIPFPFFCRHSRESGKPFSTQPAVISLSFPPSFLFFRRHSRESGKPFSKNNEYGRRQFATVQMPSPFSIAKNLIKLRCQIAFFSS